MTQASPRIMAVVLAGGLATRMGGGDKCLLPLGRSRVVLDHILERLRAQHEGPIILNANGDPARFAAYGLPVLADPPGLACAGPLAGVLAAMRAAPPGISHILSVAGDTPFFPSDLLARLRAAGDFVLASAPDAKGVWWDHPTFGLWPVALADHLRAALESGVRKITQWTDARGATRARFEWQGIDPFFNINTPEELAQAQAWAA